MAPFEYARGTPEALFSARCGLYLRALVWSWTLCNLSAEANQVLNRRTLSQSEFLPVRASASADDICCAPMAFVPSLGDACPLVGTRQGYGDVVCSTRRSRHRLTRSPASRIRMGSEAASAGTDAATTSAAIEYGGIQHVGVLVKDTEKSKKFYMEVLGMGDDHALRNPKLPFGGTFLRAGSSQVHLMELPIIDPTTGRPKHGGR